MTDDLPALKLRSWRRIGKGRLVGIATVDLADWLEISGITVFQSADDGLRAEMPDRCQVRNNQLALAGDGRPLRERPIVWRSRALRDRFSQQVLDLIRERFPGDLDSDEPSGL
jgi:hypothetical protein